MIKCLKDPDQGFPISVLKDNNLALFENGTVAEMIIPENEDDEYYDFKYYFPNDIEKPILVNPDNIPNKILLFSDSRLHWIVCLIFLSSYLLLAYTKTDIQRFSPPFGILQFSLRSFYFHTESYLPD